LRKLFELVSGTRGRRLKSPELVTEFRTRLGTTMRRKSGGL
jgi:hypothetical protein